MRFEIRKTVGSMITLPMRGIPRLGSVFLSVALVATLLVGSGVGTDSRAAASPANFCQGKIFHTNNGGLDHAKEHFAANCGHKKWNDQQNHKCEWKRFGDQGFLCYGNRGIHTVRHNEAVSSPAKQDQRGAERYWNAGRLDNAEGSTRLSASNPSGIRPSGTERRLTGKVFFTHVTKSGTVDKSCSGSVVKSTKKNTVYTAGHCLHVNGEWVTNVAFVPGYDNGKTPYGIWEAEDLWTLGGRTQQGTPSQIQRESDVGVIKLKSRNGRRIQDVTGGLGIAFEYQEHLFDRARTLGYPGRGDVHACEDTFHKFDERDLTKSVNVVRCHRLAKPGASGSPIIVSQAGYNNGYFLAGLISHNWPYYDNNWGWVYSPKFGDNMINLYRATRWN